MCNWDVQLYNLTHKPLWDREGKKTDKAEADPLALQLFSWVNIN